MMDDSLHDLPGWTITDNGDGHARVALAAEPNVAIYPSFAELDALTARLQMDAVPGWENPAALHWAYIEILARYEAATEELERLRTACVRSPGYCPEHRPGRKPAGGDQA